MSYDAIIVGGGVAGLATALNLVSKGYKTLVLEKESDIGGLLSSYKFDNFTIEKYYHHIFIHAQALLELIDRLGLSKEIEWRKGSIGYWVKGEIFKLDTPLEIMRYSRLRLIDKIRLAHFVLKIKSIKDYSFLDSISVETWVKDNCGKDVYNNFFEPLLKAKFGSSFKEISAAWLYGRIKMRSGRGVGGEKLGYLKEGFSSFINALEKKIKNGGEILTNARVSQIICEGNQVKGVRLANGEIYAKSFYMLGKIYEQQGDAAKAIEHYEKFLDLWKDADPGIAAIGDARVRMKGLRGEYP